MMLLLVLFLSIFLASATLTTSDDSAKAATTTTKAARTSRGSNKEKEGGRRKDDPRFQYNNQVGKGVVRDDTPASLDESLVEARRVTQMHPNIAQGWCNLGILLQSKDLSSHNGGALREEALKAFEKVMSYCNYKTSEILQIILAVVFF